VSDQSAVAREIAKQSRVGGETFTNENGETWSYSYHVEPNPHGLPSLEENIAAALARAHQAGRHEGMVEAATQPKRLCRAATAAPDHTPHEEQAPEGKRTPYRSG
jgi:hypothetical protein